MSDDLTYHGTISLGKLIDGLKACDEHAASVVFDFCDLVPTRVASYRGDYSHLALDFSTTGRANVADVLKVLRDALGQSFEGYKGGDYVAEPDTPVWVAAWGDAPGTAIVGVKDERHVVVLLTERIP